MISQARIHTVYRVSYPKAIPDDKMTVNYENAVALDVMYIRDNGASMCKWSNLPLCGIAIDGPMTVMAGNQTYPLFT